MVYVRCGKRLSGVTDPSLDLYIDISYPLSESDVTGSRLTTSQIRELRPSASLKLEDTRCSHRSRRFTYKIIGDRSLRYTQKEINLRLIHQSDKSRHPPSEDSVMYGTGATPLDPSSEAAKRNRQYLASTVQLNRSSFLR